MGFQETITINGNRFYAEPGETILEAAIRNHIDIPTLCHLQGAKTAGDCGVCVVEIEGRRDLVNACSTPVEKDARILTDSPRVIESRRRTIERFLSMGNHNCAIGRSEGTGWTEFQIKVQQDDAAAELCPVWGDCRLQDLAYRYQVTSEPALRVGVPYPMETANPFILRDFSRCILCGRCVRACNEIQVNNAIRFGEPDAGPGKIVTPDDRPLKESECVFCGECLQACPVGALVDKDIRYQVRRRETKQVRTTCSYCGVGCQMLLHVKNGRVVRVSGAPDLPPNYGSLCVKGRFGFHFIHSTQRLTKPLIRENGTLREAEWDEALDLVARRFTEIGDRHGSDSLGVLTSARITNEENFLAHKFARAVLKTNNIDHCARL